MVDNPGRKNAERFSAAAVIFLTVCSFAVNAAAATLYRYTSEPGDYIGGGLSDSYTSNDATITVSGTAASLSLNVRNSVDWWNISLSAPRGENLHPGIYYNAERLSFRTGRAPGLDVYGNSRGCNKVWGVFLINQIATNADGAITTLDASFTQRCQAPPAPALRGRIKFNAEPLSYSYSRDEGDYIGQVVSKVYQGATSTFTLNGNASSLQYNVSGKRDNLTAMIRAPTGKQLQSGTTYDTAGASDDTHASLSVSGCNSSIGTLKINAITFDDLGKVSGLNASFVQNCAGSSAALRGTIRYYK